MAAGHHPFVGRTAVLEALANACERAVQGAPGTVVVHGPAGIGKTAAIHRAVEAHADLQVVAARAEPADRGADFSLVRKLLAGSGRTPRLTASVATAGSHLLEMIGDDGGDRPLALVADDVHLADSASLAALAFAAHRLQTERAVLICGVRAQTAPRTDGFLGPLVRAAQLPNGAVVEVTGLGADDVAQLVRDVLGRDLQKQALDRLMTRTLGNPLWVAATLRLATREDLHSGRELPVPASVASEVHRQWATAHPQTREVLAALALLSPPRRVWEVLRLAPGAGLTQVHEAAAAGLTTWASTTEDPLDFVHPLVAAEVAALPGAELAARIHRTAAEHELDPTRRMLHLLHAGTAPDATLARQAAEMAAARVADGAALEAADLLVVAARRAATDPDAEQLRLDAAQVALAAGYQTPAREAMQLGPTTANGYRDYLGAWLAWLGNDRTQALELGQQAWSSGDPRGAMAAWLLGFLEMYDGHPAAAERWAHRLRERLPEAPSGMWRGQLAASLGLQGRVDEAFDVLGPALPEPAPLDILAETVRGYLLLWAGDFVPAHTALTACVAAADRHAHYSLAHVPRSYLAEVEHRRGGWDESEKWSATGLAVLDAFDETWATAPAFAIGVGVPARRGDFVLAGHRLATALAAAGEGPCTGVAFTQTAVAQLAHAQGDTAAVLAAGRALLRLTDRDGVDTHGALQWRVLVAEAEAASGHASAARAHAAALAASAESCGYLGVRSHAARAGALADAAEGRHDEATTGFEQAADAGREAGMPFEEAMAELLQAEHLTRTGARGAARHLAVAEELFAGLGAVPFQERCARVSGRRFGAAAGEESTAPVALTSQERLIARMVAQGASNSDIAAELFLSRRTVEFHLANAFRKLGVSSRTQLARRINEQPRRH